MKTTHYLVQWILIKAFIYKIFIIDFQQATFDDTNGWSLPPYFPIKKNLHFGWGMSQPTEMGLEMDLPRNPPGELAKTIFDQLSPDVKRRFLLVVARMFTDGFRWSLGGSTPSKWWNILKHGSKWPHFMGRLFDTFRGSPESLYMSSQGVFFPLSESIFFPSRSLPCPQPQVNGNHDNWVCGGPGCGDVSDNFGIGQMQRLAATFKGGSTTLGRSLEIINPEWLWTHGEIGWWWRKNGWCWLWFFWLLDVVAAKTFFVFDEWKIVRWDDDGMRSHQPEVFRMKPRNVRHIIVRGGRERRHMMCVCMKMGHDTGHIRNFEFLCGELDLNICAMGLWVRFSFFLYHGFRHLEPWNL